MQESSMKNLICPRCNSTNILRIPESSRATVSILESARTIRMTRYCCSDCGYTEVYVDNTKELKHLAHRFGY